MNETTMLIGSLSNDLLRVANLLQRDSKEGAMRFFLEAKKWSLQLEKKDLKSYIQHIIHDINTSDTQLNLENAEKYLMYSTLLQNYALHEQLHPDTNSRNATTA
jgi:hypothetical protein